jgi:hypothetical protein
MPRDIEQLWAEDLARKKLYPITENMSDRDPTSISLDIERLKSVLKESIRAEDRRETKRIFSSLLTLRKELLISNLRVNHNKDEKIPDDILEREMINYHRDCRDLAKRLDLIFSTVTL